MVDQLVSPRGEGGKAGGGEERGEEEREEEEEGWSTKCNSELTLLYKQLTISKGTKHA